MISKLFSKKQEKYTSTGNVFPHLNIEYLLETLSVSTIAAKDGKNNLPTSESAGLYQSEILIVNAIEKEKLYSDKIFEERVSLYQEEISRRINKFAEFKVSTFLHEVVSDFKKTTDIWNGSLERYQEEVVELKSEVQKFKKENGIDRTAVYPKNRILNWIIIIGLVLIETIVNGIFLAKGLDTGLIGGWFAAAGFSVVNIAIGGIAGLVALRIMHHKRIFYKIFGILLIIILVPCNLFLNLWLTQFRDSMIFSSDEVTFELMLEKIQTSLINFHDPLSPLVFMLGIFFFFISMIDFYNYDDRYPGYGKLDRRYNKARRDFVTSRENYLHDLEESKNLALNNIEQTVDSADKNIQAKNEYTARLKNLPKIYESHIRDIEKIGEQLLDLYRDINRKNRSTPEPSHFALKYKIELNIDSISNRINCIVDSFADKNSETDLGNFAKEATLSVINEFDKSQTKIKQIAQILI